MEENKRGRSAQQAQEQAREVNKERRKKKYKRNYLLHYIIMAVLILAIGITLSLTVFFNTTEIVVEGNVTHSTEDIIAYAQVAVGDNLFRTNLKEVEENVMAHTVDLDSVNAERRLPDKLGIVVTQATPATAYKSGDLYNIISTGGRIIAQDAALDGYPGVIVFDGTKLGVHQLGDFVYDTEEYKTLQSMVEAIQSVGFEKITAVEINDSNEIKFCYDNRITVQLGSVLELQYKLQTVKKVIDDYVTDEEGVIDASEPTVAYFRPMTMEVQTAEGKAVTASAPDEPSAEPADTPSDDATSE